ncbi:MAG TPA: SDR family oxidoreductase [Candidatus Acidoferrum sp.]|nr:SDR family oxidoreductase [Candidatus Acidoferrum sp.]
MRGKSCVVTGANSGIGMETAVALADSGARVAVVCRTPARSEQTVGEIKRRSPGADLLSFAADLSSQRAVRVVAAELASALPRLSVLVNNAGLMLRERVLTEDGIEATFAVNHLAYFMLTRLLEPALVAGRPSRVVNVSSRAHLSGTIRFDDLMGSREYDGWKAYAQSKLANVLFTYEHARRLAGTGVTANCLHPGVVGTNIGHDGPMWIRFGIKLVRPFLLSPARGADTSIYLASSPAVEGVSGKYFVGRGEERTSDESHDRAVAARLWKVSEELTGLAAS